MSPPILLTGIGLAGVIIGGLLAFRSDHSDGHKSLQTAAGLLLITGFSCFGVALYHLWGSPLP